MNHHTLDQLHALGLKGMARAWEIQMQQPDTQKMSFQERFGMIIDAEVSERDTRKIDRLLKTAKLRYSKAALEDIEYHAGRKLDRQFVMSLAECGWVRQRQNLIITGATGAGKSWIGCAFGVQACRMGLTTYYTTSTQLFEQLAMARADGSLPKLRRHLIKLQLLIIDDLGLGGIDSTLGPVLLEIVDLQSTHGSLLLTSQFPSEQWYDQFNDPTVADAILDRIVHRAHHLKLEGESMRKRKGKNNLST